MRTHRLPLLQALLLLLVGCGDDLVALGGAPTPLARFQVLVTGDLASLQPAPAGSGPVRLRVALVWGQQYQSEAFCSQQILAQLAAQFPELAALLPDDPSTTAVALAGCRDVAGFVPQWVAADAPVVPGQVTPLDLVNLPGAQAMVGPVSGRIAYGSLLVYDDRNDNGSLDLHRVCPLPNQGGGPGGGGGGPNGGGQGPGGTGPIAKCPAPDSDFVYGASFASMLQPHRQVAFREGTFNTLSFFYPVQGCTPPVGFSVLDVGPMGLDPKAKPPLPPIAAGKCTVAPLTQPVEIPLQATETLRDVACLANGGTQGTTRYREVPEKAPDLTAPWLCRVVAKPKVMEKDEKLAAARTAVLAKLADNVELVLARPASDCKGLVHYVLRGCDDEAEAYCEVPDWDFTTPTNQPPEWWPCPVAAGIKP